MTPTTRLRLWWLMMGLMFYSVYSYATWRIREYPLLLAERDRYRQAEQDLQNVERLNRRVINLENLVNGQSTMIREHRKICPLPMSWHVDPEADRE